MDGLTEQISRFSFTFTVPGAKPLISTLPTCHVDKLPSELISWIAFWVVSDRSGSDQCPSWSLEQHRHLAGVCRSWRNAVLGAPYLWTRMNGFGMMERQLYLSKSLPLDIRVRMQDYSYTSAKADLQTLSLHRDRWRSLCLEAFSTASASIVSYLDEETPSLRHLCLDGRPYRRPLNLTSINTPNLQSLWISFQVVHMPAKVLGNLQVLHLTSAGYPHSALCRMLTECVSLTLLKLEKLEGRPNKMAVEQSVVLNLITLPALTHLEIIECSNTMLKQLLPSIDAPALQSFTFRGNLKCSQLHRKDIVDKAVFSGLIARLHENHPWTRLMVKAGVGYLHIVVAELLNFKMPYAPGAAYKALIAAIPVFQLDQIDVALRIRMESVTNKATYEGWGTALGSVQLVSLTSSHGDIDNLQWLCDFLRRPPPARPDLTRLTILLEESFHNLGASTRDAERNLRGMMRCRPNMVVELGELKILDVPTKTAESSLEEVTKGGNEADKGCWSFIF